MDITTKSNNSRIIAYRKQRSLRLNLMIMNAEKTLIQCLDMKVGERATCTAGYPRLATVEVECIKDFSDAPSMDVVNDPFTYVKLVDGRFGLLTSHMISAAWYKTRELSHVLA